MDLELTASLGRELLRDQGLSRKNNRERPGSSHQFVVVVESITFACGHAAIDNTYRPCCRVRTPGRAIRPANGGMIYNLCQLRGAVGVNACEGEAEAETGLQRQRHLGRGSDELRC